VSDTAITDARLQLRVRRRRNALMAKYLLVGLLGAVLVGHALGALVAFTRIKQVIVQSPDPGVAQEVSEVLDVPPWANLVTSRLSLIAGQAERCPRVKRADFERKFPDRLIVTVEPRQPLLAWEKGDQWMLVDPEGVCLYWTSRPDEALLRVTGLALQARVGQRLSGEWFERSCVVAEALAKAERYRPWTLDASCPSELSVLTGSGIRGIVGTTDADLDRRVRIFAEALVEYEKQGKRLGLMELRTDPPIAWPEGERPDRSGGVSP